MEDVLDRLAVIGIGIAFALSLVTFAIQLSTKWWKTRAGVAFWAFNTSFLFLAGHFGFEELSGIENPLREVVAIAIVCGTLGWACWTVIFKRFLWSREELEWDPFHRNNTK